MSFEVIEQFIEGKESKDLCEDRIVLTKVVAGVIDGATSKSALSFGAMRQGKIAGILLEEVINGLTGAEDAYTFVERANDRFCAFYRERELLAHMASNPVDRLNASVVLYNDVRQELWMIGDCQAICGDRPYKNPKLIDEVLANLRSFYIQLALHQGATVEQLLQDDIGRRQILPHLKQQHAFQNNLPDSRFSYGTLDGFLQDKSKIKVYPITDEEIIH